MSDEQEDYQELSNEELTGVLRKSFPDLIISPVTDDTRNTITAILKIWKKTGGQ